MTIETKRDFIRQSCECLFKICIELDSKLDEARIMGKPVNEELRRLSLECIPQILQVAEGMISVFNSKNKGIRK